jgi:hypothetical protein
LIYFLLILLRPRYCRHIADYWYAITPLMILILTLLRHIIDAIDYLLPHYFHYFPRHLHH